MSSYVYMKVLESSAERYDRGILMLSGGRISAYHEAIAAAVARPGARVLDVGCGTGGVALACAARGADVVGIDINTGMLEVAQARPVPAAGAVTWLELGAAGIEDRFEVGTLDAVVSCLAFSELTPDERVYVLRTIHARLVPGGQVVVADEVPPATAGGRLWHTLIRAPQAAWTWALTQTSTRAVEDLAGLVLAAGFDRIQEQRPHPAFAIVTGTKGADEP